MGIRALRRFLPYMRPHRREAIVMVSGALAGLGFATCIPLVIKAVIDGPIAHRQPQLLPLYAVLLVALALAEAAAIFLRRNFAGVVSLRMETDIRNDFYAHLQSLPVTFHDDWQSGQLLSRAVGDINVIRRFVGFGLIFVSITTVQFFVVIVLLFGLNGPLAAVTLLTAIPVVLLSRRFFKLYGAIARRIQDQQGDLTTVVEEAATGVRVIKSFGRGPEMIRRFGIQAGELRETNLDAIRTRAWLWTLLSYVPNLNLVATLLLGGLAVQQGRMTMGGLVAYMSYLFMLIWPMEALGWILAMGEEAGTATDRLAEVFDARPDIADPPGALPLRPAGGEVRFEDVWFKYPASDEWVLRGATLVVRPGETMGLVGRTGCGKTSLVSLVPRLYDIQRGRISLDGQDVSAVTLSSLRRAIGIAFEDPILFSASVRENLVMGRPETSDAEIERALEAAQAGFVRELPWGLDTRVGEQGHTLSGGQRQRLALARAVLGRPRLLLLDDPLSSVDVHTESIIEAALATLLEGVTALLVVHRPSTLALADRVALIDGGAVVAVGTHHEMLATQPLYRALLSEKVDEAVLPGARERPA